MGRKSKNESDSIAGVNCILQVQTCPKCMMKVFGGCQYLLGKTLCVLQAVCERLDKDIAAALTQSIVVLTFLAGLGQQSQPDLGHRVTTGLLPEHM